MRRIRKSFKHLVNTGEETKDYTLRYIGLILMGIIAFSLVRLILILEGKTNYVWMDFIGIIILSLILLFLIKPFTRKI